MKPYLLLKIAFHVGIYRSMSIAVYRLTVCVWSLALYLIVIAIGQVCSK